MPLLLNLLPARFLLTLREWFDYKISHCVLSNKHTNKRSVNQMTKRTHILVYSKTVICVVRYDRNKLLITNKTNKQMQQLSYDTNPCLIQNSHLWMVRYIFVAQVWQKQAVDHRDRNSKLDRGAWGRLWRHGRGYWDLSLHLQIISKSKNPIIWIKIRWKSIDKHTI